MATQPAPRNKTLKLTESEQTELASQLVRYNVNGINDDLPLVYKQRLSFLNDSLTNKVIVGDMCSVSQALPMGFVDLLFLDPPYNLTKTFNTHHFKRQSESSYRNLLQNWFAVLQPLLKPNASIYVCGDWRSSSAIFEVGSEFFTPINRIVWEREKGRGALHNYKNNTEDIWYFVCNPKQYTFNVEAIKLRRKVIAPYTQNGEPKDWQKTEQGNFRDTFPSNIWTDISIPYWSMPENTDHPTQKPEKLLAKILLASTNPDDMVLDPFLGSGTTAAVATKLGRNFLGIELDEYYATLALKRIELAKNNKRIQGYDDGVFWERNSLPLQPKPKSRTVDRNIKLSL